jgi:hypothetical protein
MPRISYHIFITKKHYLCFIKRKSILGKKVWFRLPFHKHVLFPKKSAQYSTTQDGRENHCLTTPDNLTTLAQVRNLQKKNRLDSIPIKYNCKHVVSLGLLACCCFQDRTGTHYTLKDTMKIKITSYPIQN